MQAKETRLQEIIEGTKQYVIPLFQRSYSWTTKEWSVLWKDIEELLEMDNPRVHFMGSIVNMPTTSVPHGVAKYLLIDGQQRITTILIILSVLRDKAREIENNKLADKIHNTLLVNQYEDGNDYYKLLPTQIDRPAYQQIVDHSIDDSNNQIKEAYDYFEKRIKENSNELAKILKIISDSFSVVSIVLDADDNPYLVFESLNAKGRTLTQADLIKNYFFMRIHQSKQEEIYKKYWLPMQQHFDEKLLPEYIRHYMMKEGGIIKQTDVYYELKDRVNVDNAIKYIQNLSKFSQFYRNIIHPEFEPNDKLKKCFIRLNRIEQTTSYPVLLYLYGEYDTHNITLDDFVEVLHSLENYLIRRFVCDYKTSELNKIFPSAYSSIHSASNITDSFKEFLSRRGYPKDNEFKAKLKESRLYGGGDRVAKTKFILESIEESYHHKEKIDSSNLTIEHIMPQTLSVWWQNYLGEDWGNIHDDLLNTIGNLTLTAYNSELSNDNFDTKRDIYKASHLELNKRLSEIATWNREQILQRATILADKAAEIWPYFGDNEVSNTENNGVTGTSPFSLEILGEPFPVKNWRDVFELTLNTLAELEPGKFVQIATALSNYIGKEKNKFRAIRQLNNGYYIEVNQSATSIYKNCLAAIQIVGLSTDDWIVCYTTSSETSKGNVTINNENTITNERLSNTIKAKCIERIKQNFNLKLNKYSNSLYKSNDKSFGFYFSFSKVYQQPHYEKYWFGYRKKNELDDCEKRFYVFGCKDENTIIVLPQEELDKHLEEMNTSIDSETGEVKHWHIVFTKGDDKKVKWLLSKPQMHDIDITDHLLLN